MADTTSQGGDPAPSAQEQLRAYIAENYDALHYQHHEKHVEAHAETNRLAQAVVDEKQQAAEQRQRRAYAEFGQEPPDKAQATARELARRWGPAWPQKRDAAANLLQQALGPKGFDIVEQAAGDDVELVTRLINLTEGKGASLLAPTIRQYLASNIYFGNAKLELAQLWSGSDHYDALARGDEVAHAKELALRILADPPKAIVRALQEAAP